MILQGWMEYHPWFGCVYFLRLHCSVSLTAHIFVFINASKAQSGISAILKIISTWKKNIRLDLWFCFCSATFLIAHCFSSGTFSPQVLLRHIKSKTRRRALQLWRPWELTFELSNCAFYAEVRLELRGLPKLLQNRKLLC